MIPSDALHTIIAYLASTTGIDLPETMYSSLQTFLDERLRETGMSARSYIQMLEREPSEFSRFVDSVTINETYFFREERQFRFLEKTLFPHLARDSETVKIWSSSCASGEEAISLHCLAKEVFGDTSFQVYASDINDTVLKKFNTGVYTPGSFRDDGRAYHNLLEKYGARVDNKFHVDRTILEAITRKPVNLYSLPSDSLPNDFDLILLRNTLIYFNIQQRERIIKGILSHLKKGGVLLTSTTEAPLVADPHLLVLEKDGIYYFRHKTDEELNEGTAVTREIIVPVLKELPPAPRPKPATILETPETPAPVTMDAILSMAAYKLNNPFFKLTAHEAYQQALVVMKVLYHLNLSEFETARKLTDSISTGPPLTSYLKAQIHRHNGQEQKALAYLDETLSFKTDFWPARFYRCMILIQQNRHAQAAKDITRTISDIEEYISNAQYNYQALLDGFNGRYFLTICMKWKVKQDVTG